MPPGLDWISMDYYRLNASYIQTFREVYETDLYPRLSPHQRAVVVRHTIIAEAWLSLV